MAEFTFTVHGRIVPAVRMTQRGKFTSVQASRSLAYKDQIGWTARQAGAAIIDGPITLVVVASVFKRKWDASNVLKIAEDALNGVCWRDDSAVIDARIVVEDRPSMAVDTLTITITGGSGNGSSERPDD